MDSSYSRFFFRLGESSHQSNRVDKPAFGLSQEHSFDENMLDNDRMIPFEQGPTELNMSDRYLMGCANAAEIHYDVYAQSGNFVDWLKNPDELSGDLILGDSHGFDGNAMPWEDNFLFGGLEKAFRDPPGPTHMMTALPSEAAPLPFSFPKNRQTRQFLESVEQICPPSDPRSGQLNLVNNINDAVQFLLLMEGIVTDDFKTRFDNPAYFTSIGRYYDPNLSSEKRLKQIFSGPKYQMIYATYLEIAGRANKLVHLVNYLKKMGADLPPDHAPLIAQTCNHVRDLLKTSLSNTQVEAMKALQKYGITEDDMARFGNENDWQRSIARLRGKEQKLERLRKEYGLSSTTMKSILIYALPNRDLAVVEEKLRRFKKRGLALPDSALGLALQCGFSDELKKKLRFIVEYKGKGMDLTGTALGLALQSGRSDELKKKLETIDQYKGKGVDLTGTALGLALQCGSSDELKKKLEIIVQYKGKGVDLTGNALGLALQHGSSDELKKKLAFIVEYKGKGVDLTGNALGRALQHGSSDELKKKLAFIVEYKGKGVDLTNHAVGLALQSGSSDELTKKLEIIVKYKGNGVDLTGTALGMALQSGSSEELKKKLEVIVEYKGKGVNLTATALGWALQGGSSDELKKKLAFIVQYKGKGADLTGTALGQALQHGSSEILRKKLDLLQHLFSSHVLSEKISANLLCANIINTVDFVIFSKIDTILRYVVEIFPKEKKLSIDDLKSLFANKKTLWENAQAFLSSLGEAIPKPTLVELDSRLQRIEADEAHKILAKRIRTSNGKRNKTSKRLHGFNDLSDRLQGPHGMQFKKIAVAGDGNCQLRALHQNANLDYVEIRREYANKLMAIFSQVQNDPEQEAKLRGSLSLRFELALGMLTGQNNQEVAEQAALDHLKKDHEIQAAMALYQRFSTRMTENENQFINRLESSDFADDLLFYRPSDGHMQPATPLRKLDRLAHDTESQNDEDRRQANEFIESLEAEQQEQIRNLMKDRKRLAETNESLRKEMTSGLVQYLPAYIAAHIGRDGTWMDDFDLAAYSILYQKNIIVLEESNEPPGRPAIERVRYEHGGEEEKPIHVLFSGGNHYSALEEIDAEPVQEKDEQEESAELGHMDSLLENRRHTDKKHRVVQRGGMKPREKKRQTKQEARESRLGLRFRIERNAHPDRSNATAMDMA